MRRRDDVLPLASRPRRTEERTRRWPWIVGGLAGAAAATAVYATLVEPRWLQRTRPRIHIHGLPRALEGLRIALLTDMHAGSARSLQRVRAAVRLALEAGPDLIALAGDFAADDQPDFDRIFEALEPLEAPLGVYAVPGNHDYNVGIARWRQGLRRHPRIRDLTNRAVRLDVNGARLCVAGVDDFYRGTPRLDFLPPPTTRDLTVLLAHGPDQAERLRRSADAVDLVLSGHTHGGQVQLPFVGAPVSSAAHPELYEEGLRRRPWTQVYTSRGIGTVGLPIRFLARPEVAVLELTGAPRPRK